MKTDSKIAAALTALAFAAVPAAALATSSNASVNSTAQKQCRAIRTADTKTAFNHAYGTNKNFSNAFGKCVSKMESQDNADQASAHSSAEKTCRSQQSDPNFATNTGGGKTFDQFYGTNKNDRNAFGNCVSSKQKALASSAESDQVQAQENAAKTCRAQQNDPNFATNTGGGKTFTAFYGTGNGHNAFGKCVSQHAKAQQNSNSTNG